MAARPDVVEVLRSASAHPIVRCFPGAIVVFDHDLRYISAGGLALDGNPLSAEMLVGRTLFEVFPADVVSANEPLYRRALAGEDSVADVAFQDRIYLQRVGPLRDEDGQVVAGMAFTQDVTADRQSRRAQEEHDRVLSEERRRLRAAQSIGRIGSWEMDVATHEVTWSDTLVELYGLEPDGFGGDLAAALDCIHPDDRSQVDAAVAACATTGEPVRIMHRVHRANDGDLRWFDARGERVVDGSIVRLAGAVVDVTEQVLTEARITAASALQRAVISASPDIIFVYDIPSRATVWTNRSLTEMLGFGPTDVAALGDGDMFAGLVPEEDRARFDATLREARNAADGAIVQLDHRLHHADGTPRWFCRRTTPLHRDEQGRVDQLVGVLRDTTDAVAAEERLEHSALHDDLTGLPNRRLVTDRLARALDRSGRDGDVAVLFCDLDGFKRVNDTHGHHAGDAVLVETAARMEGAIRSGDTVGRMGGDEFVIIGEMSPGEDPRTLGDRLAQRIRRVVAKPIMVDGVEHRVTVSIGICVAGQGDDADSVLRNSDTAMYLAKSRGKDGHVLFEESLRADVLGRDSTERQIRRVIDDDSFEVYYQPIVEPVTGRVRSVEALLRIPDGTGGYLDTLDAVRVAEQTALISAIDEGVLRRACTQVAAWRRLPGHADLAVTVNRSAAEMARPGFYGRIMEIVAATGLDPQALTIEITETVLLDAARDTIADLRRLRADGIGIAIDDFGTGYASLRYLATLPISCLKVDRSFTAGLPDDPTCTTILRATVVLAADLGLKCIVEGVETIEQRDALPKTADLLAQGYLYGRPEPGAALLPTHLAPMLRA